MQYSQLQHFNALLYTFLLGIQHFYQGEQLPQNAPQQQTQAPSIHPATQSGGLSFYSSYISLSFCGCEK